MANPETLIDYLNARIEALEKELDRVNTLVNQAKEILTPLLKEVESYEIL